MFHECTDTINPTGKNEFGFCKLLSIVEIILYYITIIANLYILRKIKQNPELVLDPFEETKTRTEDI